MCNFYSDIFSHFFLLRTLTLLCHIIFTSSVKTLSCLIYLLSYFLSVYSFKSLTDPLVKHPIFNKYIFCMGT